MLYGFTRARGVEPSLPEKKSAATTLAEKYALFPCTEVDISIVEASDEKYKSSNVRKFIQVV